MFRIWSAFNLFNYSLSLPSFIVNLQTSKYNYIYQGKISLKKKMFSTYVILSDKLSIGCYTVNCSLSTSFMSHDMKISSLSQREKSFVLSPTWTLCWAEPHNLFFKNYLFSIDHLGLKKSEVNLFWVAYFFVILTFFTIIKCQHCSLTSCLVLTEAHSISWIALGRLGPQIQRQLSWILIPHNSYHRHGRYAVKDKKYCSRLSCTAIFTTVCDFIKILLYFQKHYTKPQEDEGLLKVIVCTFKDQ